MSEIRDRIEEVLDTPKKAVELGHDLYFDPPSMSSALGWTCRRCGMAVLRHGVVEYGQAMSNECEAPRRFNRV